MSELFALMSIELAEIEKAEAIFFSECDENYMTSDGGAALRQNGVCDYELTRRLAEFTVVSPLASECILLQPVTIS